MGLFSLLAAVVQAAVPPVPALGGAKLPLLFCVVLYYSLEHDTGVMLSAATAAGLLQDSLSPAAPGYSVLCFAAMGLASGRFRRLVQSESAVIAVLFGFAGCAAATLLSYCVLRRGGAPAWSLWNVTLKAAGTGLLGALAAPALFAAAGCLDRRLGNVRIKREIHGFD
jgi:rod shape-determining protein MreD